MNNKITENQKLQYIRSLYDLILDWYKCADSKAQSILTLNGALITFITGFTLIKPEEVKSILGTFEWFNLVLLIVTAMFLILSVGCALNSFRSRLNKNEQPMQMVRSSGIPPEKMWFFGDIASLDKHQFIETINSIDEEFELQALSDQIHILSINVLHKHKWINKAFFAFGIGIMLFISFFVSYIITVFSI